MTSKEDIGVTKEERDLSGKVVCLKTELSTLEHRRENIEQAIKDTNARLAELEIDRRPKPAPLNREKIHRQLVTHLLDIDTEKPVTGMIYGTQMSKYLCENYHISQFIDEDGQTMWHLIIERSEWIADSPEELEDKLFDFLDDEGVTLSDLYSPHMGEFPEWTMDFILPKGFEDVSWHNDAMPRFENEKLGLRIWADYTDPKDSEWGEDRDDRFLLETLEDDMENPDPNEFAETFATIEELVHWMKYEMTYQKDDTTDSEDRLNLMEKGLDK